MMTAMEVNDDDNGNDESQLRLANSLTNSNLVDCHTPLQTDVGDNEKGMELKAAEDTDDSAPRSGS